MTPIRAIGAAALTVLALGAAAAYGEANHKVERNDYQAESGAVTHAALPDDLVVLGHSQSQAETNREQATSSSSASGPAVAGNQLGPKVTCSADGASGNGRVAQRKSAAAVAQDLGLASVTLLEGSCHSRAVKTNNAMGEARTDVAAVEVPGVGEASVLSTGATTKTTSGQSRSTSEFTVAQAELAQPSGPAAPVPAAIPLVQEAGQVAGPVATALPLDASPTDGSVALLECSTSAFDNNGTSGSGEQVTLLAVGDTQLFVPTECPVAMSSVASYTR